MNKLDLTDIEDLVHIENLNGAPVTTLMYIHYDKGDSERVHADDLFKDKKELRKLKVDELIEDIDNSSEIDYLKEKVSAAEEISEMYPAIIAPLVKSKNIKLTKKTIVTGDEYLPEMVTQLRTEILNEIYKISAINKPLNTRTANFDLTFTKKESEDLRIVSRKILSRILMCSNFIAIEGRIGPSNTVIMNRKYASLLESTVGITKSINNNSYNFGKLTGIDVIIDDTLGDKIVNMRKPSDKSQLTNNIVLFYNEIDNGIRYEVIQVEECQSNYIEFDISGLDI